MNTNLLTKLNEQNDVEATATFKRWCGADRWSQLMEQWRPHESPDELFAAGEKAFDQLAKDDWLQAFSAHPKIGDVESLRKKYAQNGIRSAQEQSGVGGAQEAVIQELARLNAEYEARHGFIFIVCATGKTAAEMLEILRDRIGNATEQEIRNASIEQRKITRIRLEKLEP